MRRRCGTFKRDYAETIFLWQDDPDEAEHYFDLQDSNFPPALRWPVQRVQNSLKTVEMGAQTVEDEAGLQGKEGQPTPCERVFEVFTLAEQILLQLHPTDILCGAQQTCRSWLHTVYQSTFIQELLFFKPIPAKFVYYFESDAPVGTWKHRLWFGGMIFFQALGTEVFGPLPVVENPYLFRLRDPRRLSGGSHFTSTVQPSWKRMLATQPPVTELWACSSDRWTDLRCIKGSGPRAIQGFVEDTHVKPQPPAITLNNLSLVEPLYGIIQGSLLRHFEGWEQIKALKKKSKPDEQFLEILLAGEEFD